MKYPYKSIFESQPSSPALASTFGSPLPNLMKLFPHKLQTKSATPQLIVYLRHQIDSSQLGSLPSHTLNFDSDPATQQHHPNVVVPLQHHSTVVTNPS
ncbi:hypothetical protein ACOSQ4_003307 [Xanthoceras sorbifolium]